MPPLAITAEAILVIGLIAAFVNFRFLMYPFVPSMNPVAQARRLNLTGNTLLISDLHLKAHRPFEYAKKLRSFIEKNRVSNLVIDGDFFDSPKDARKLLDSSQSEKRLLELLGLTGLPLAVYWVIGSPHHDPQSPKKSWVERGGLEPLGVCAIIQSGQSTVMVYHGHDMSLLGALGHAWDRFVSRLSLERFWKRFAKIDQDVWVVFGHTHIPGVDMAGRVANCGGWQVKPFVHPSKTGVLVSAEQAPLSVRIA
jgi:predicted phosphodiesterase